MMGFYPATPRDFALIADIARRTWPETYGQILSREQIEFMLDKFYSTAALMQNLADGHRIMILDYQGTAVGFYALQPGYKPSVSHLHKIYLLPEFHGRGMGSAMLSDAENLARTLGDKTMTLNVNRFNPAQQFYSRHGFETLQNVDIPIGHGYWMEDYIMAKSL